MCCHSEGYIYYWVEGKDGGREDLGQDQVKKETEVPGLSQRAWRTSSKGKYVRIWEYVCVCECRYERVMCYVYKSMCIWKYIYVYMCMWCIEEYVCVYVCM